MKNFANEVDPRSLKCRETTSMGKTPSKGTKHTTVCYKVTTFYRFLALNMLVHDNLCKLG